MTSTYPTALITGASGFIGANLAEALVARHGPGSVIALVAPDGRPIEQERLLRLRGLGVRILTCDLLRLPEPALEVPRFDILYHLAAYTETETSSPQMRVNSEGTRHLLDWLGGSLRGKRLVFTGTMASYDRDRPWGPIDERTPCTPRTPYGTTKLLAEESIRSRAPELEYTFTILRLCTVLGPEYRAGGMFGIFPQMLAAGSLATSLNWPGKTSIISVLDVVNILLAVPALPQAANELYVVSNGEDPSFDQLLALIASVLGLPRRRIALPRPLWRLLFHILWPIAGSPLAPYRFRVFCWRVCNMIGDGMYASSRKLDALIGSSYRSIEDSLRQAFADGPSSPPAPGISARRAARTTP